MFFSMKKSILIPVFLFISLPLLASPKGIIGEDEIEKLKNLDHSSEIYQMLKPTGRLKLQAWNSRLLHNFIDK